MPSPRFGNSYVMSVISLVLVLGSIAESRVVNSKIENFDYPAINCRKHSAVLTDFGAVGDGKTSNTKAFNDAINKLSQYANDGGAQLIVPPGKWLTGSFNLTSHFTLFLQKGAVILGSQVESEWPKLPILPSYGGGKYAPNERFSSLIFGTHLTDVIITGNHLIK
ncbi:probable polygalacturonase [Cicer arietinum]|uniref:Probable polygalacturonase n=1 Tax=Cicer arietinum TaxID=3827 RepID=A0A3Q7XXV1_CICAR|nr:probable polygalacturonase [Cicer arietinum]